LSPVFRDRVSKFYFTKNCQYLEIIVAGENMTAVINF